MNSYNPKEIEPKWQKKWEEEDFNKAEDLTDKEKAYFLIEFPYPSGAGLHVGHVRSYVALDIMARKARMEGKNVLYPIGWDAFGLPTENYAIKNKIHPIIATEKNINTFRGQLKSLGLSFDWSREVNTTDPKYYKWTQWIFLKLWERGLAYKQKTTINWCPSCRIGLANEEVIDSKCERCGTLTEKKEKEQWMLKITEYADRLLKDLDTVDYSERIKTQQVNWIGKSEGAEINFNIADSNLSIRVFTTRPDTIFGATFMVISPEHPVIENLAGKIENFDEVSDYIFKAKNKSDMDRTQLNKDKSGVELKEVLAINPANKEEIPVFVADYILMSYGTGAIMSVPAHDERDYEFAKKYNLPIKPVVLPVVDSFDLDELKISQDKYKKDGKDPFLEMQFDEIKNRQAYIGEGINWNSYSEKISLDGLETKKAKEKIIKWLEDNKKGEKSIKYKLRDWVFSRQHYWGEPIPMINCSKCGFVPVPESELPVTLPEVEHYEPRDDGESPLKTIDSFVNVKCPKCGGEAERETDTMPNWAGSSWYFLRYIDPHNDLALVDKEKAKYFMPIDLYNGGMEHTTLHLLYSRFWNKFLFDIGVSPVSEPYSKRRSHGMVLAEDDQKMSKSRGNVVNPDELIEKFGSDSLRIYEMFMGPFSDAIPWNTDGMKGVYRFLERVWSLQDKLSEEGKDNSIIHKTIKKVGEDIEEMKFNTAVSQLMICVNELMKIDSIKKSDFEKFLILLAPFAPHIASEIWKLTPNKGSIFKEGWPSYDESLIIEEEVKVVVQINGKVRATIIVSVGTEQEKIKKLALQDKNIQKYISEGQIKKVIYVPDRLINFVV